MKMKQVKELAIEILTAQGEAHKIWMVPNQPSFVVENNEYVFEDIQTRDNAAEILLNEGYHLIA